MSTLLNPFVGGMVTDRPAWQIGPQFSPFAQDGYSPQGVYKQRGGWAYDGTTADVAANLLGVWRTQFILADATRTITTRSNDVFIHNSASSGTTIVSSGSPVNPLPRCVYNDQLILCSQDGVTPIRLYSGSPGSTSMSNPTTAVYTANQATITGTVGSWGAGVVSGTYVSVYGATGDIPPIFFARVLERQSSTVISVENMRASSAAPTIIVSAGNDGLAYPSVDVYDAGTGTLNGSSTFTGAGVAFSGGAWGSVINADSLLIVRPAGSSSAYRVQSITSATVLNLGTVAASDSNVNYMILRRCPFKDAAAHNGSFWGTGVAQFPNRIYVLPPGQPLTVPPGASLPFDPAVQFTSPNVNDFLMDFIDVPTPFDGDSNVAILPSPNPLLVLKRDAVHGVYGSFPNFSQNLIAAGVGCIDIRSAQSYDEGQFWCGENGIYWYTGGRIVDLTAGRINREWRALTRDFDYGTSDYCSLAVSQGHLIVHITTGGGTTQRTYLCDLRDQSWQSRVSNFTPRHMFTSRIPGEAEKLLAVSDARQGRVIDFAPALNGSGTAKDDAGSAPRLQAYTPEGIDGTDIDDDQRLLDLAVHANVYDAGAAGSTAMSVSVVTQDALTEKATVTSSLDAISSDTTDRLDRHYFRHVDKRGRRHQVQLAVTTLGTDTAATKVEVAQIDAAFRPARART